MVPAHKLILELARAALVTRDDDAAWKRDVREAAIAHEKTCDALWEELERQVKSVFPGATP